MGGARRREPDRAGRLLLIAALIIGIMVIALSALTLLWHAVTLIMIIMLPLIATIGIHPSQQKLLKGWLQTFIHSFVLRAGFGVILTVLLVLYQMILPAKISLGMQLLMLLLVTVSVVMMLKKLLAGNFSPQIAGAQDALGVGDMANTVGGKLAQYAPNAAAGVAKTTGRVAGRTAAGTAKVAKKGTLAAARTYDNKKNDGRWQKEGKLSTPHPPSVNSARPSTRPQRSRRTSSRSSTRQSRPSESGKPQKLTRPRAAAAVSLAVVRRRPTCHGRSPHRPCRHRPPRPRSRAAGPPVLQGPGQHAGQRTRAPAAACARARPARHADTARHADAAHPADAAGRW